MCVLNAYSSRSLPQDGKVQRPLDMGQDRLATLVDSPSSRGEL